MVFSVSFKATSSSIISSVVSVVISSVVFNTVVLFSVLRFEYGDTYPSLPTEVFWSCAIWVSVLSEKSFVLGLVRTGIFNWTPEYNFDLVEILFASANSFLEIPYLLAIFVTVSPF